MVQGSQEERAELPFRRINALEPVAGKQVDKEILDQILSIVRLVAEVAHIGVKRFPVSAAKGLQGGRSLRGV